MADIILIIVGCIIGFAALLFGFWYFVISAESSKVKHPENTYGTKGKRILIAYASRAGSTAYASDIMGKAISKEGCIAEIRKIKNVSNISGYDGFILGTAIRACKLMPEYRKFISRNSKTLNEKPTAFFFLCMYFTKNAPKFFRQEAFRQAVAGYLDPVNKFVKPSVEGQFAGKMNYSKLNSLTRIVIEKMVKIPEGDFMKIDEMKKWAIDFVTLNVKWMIKS